MNAAEEGTPEAVELIVKWEEDYSYASRPQRDPTGTWEIGYGSIWDWSGPGAPTRVTANTAPINEDTARQWLRWELHDVVGAIANDVHVALTENQLSALESFAYNVGTGNFGSSTLLRKLNAGDYTGAAAQFAVWDHAGGRELAGLVALRADEEKLFETP